MLGEGKYNTGFLIIGLIGTVLCFVFWYRNRSIPPLIGIGLFGYFLLSSLFVLLRAR
jgi:hypothetical protein